MIKYYFFAGFIFALILLTLFVIKALFHKEKSQNDDNKDEKLLRLYRQIEDMLESFEEYVSEVKKEIEDEKYKISLSLEEIENKLDVKIKMLIKENQNTLQKTGKSKATQSSKSNQKELTKQEKVKLMYENGIKKSDIAKELNITNSEIDLIIGVNI